MTFFIFPVQNKKYNYKPESKWHSGVCNYP